MPSKQQHLSLQSFHKESYLWSLCCCQYDEEMAKDVLQAAYLKFFEGKARFAGKSSLKTWFFSVIRFTAIDAFRKQEAAPVILSDAIEMGSPDSSDLVDEAPQKNLIKKILEQLSSQQREILTLVFYNDLTIETSAEVLGISVGAARSHYSRAKVNFKKWLVHYQYDKILKE